MKIKDKKGKEIEIKNVKSQKAISTTPPSKWGTLTDFSEITPEEALTEDAVMPIVANGELKQLKYEDFKTSFEDLIIDRTNVIGYEKFDSIQDWTPVGTGQQDSPWVVNNGDYILGLPLSPNVYINDDAIMIGDYFYFSSSNLSERRDFHINITGRKFIQTEYFTRENNVAFYESFYDNVERYFPVQLKFVKIKENLYFVEKIILQAQLVQYVETFFVKTYTVPQQEYFDATSANSYDFSGKKAVQLEITSDSVSEISIKIGNEFQELTINLKEMGSKSDMKISMQSNIDGSTFNGQSWLDSPRFGIYNTTAFFIKITKGATDSPGILTFYFRNKKLIAVK